VDLPCAKQAETGDCSDYINDCVHSANVVQVNGIDGLTVDGCFGFGEAVEDGGCLCCVALRKRRFAEQAQDVIQLPSGLFFDNVDAGVCGGDSSALHFSGCERPASEWQT
jgi:hypothetical protein